MGWLLSVWDGGAAGERLIAKSRLPVSSDEELGTIQEPRAVQSGPSKIGAIKYRFEKICIREIGTRQIGVAELRSPEIGAPKLRLGKIKPAQVEPSQSCLR